MGEFDNPLVLTSPMMREKRVRDAQWLLSGHNRFQTTPNPIHPYTGAIDGIYGPITAGAAKAAKYSLGYPDAQIDTVFGQEIYEYLDNTELPPEYVALRNARLNAVPKKVKALELAITFLGVTEKPANSNDTQFGAWYGFNGVPWCAIFVSYCISHVAGYNWKHSYVPEIAADAASGRDFMRITYHPEPGDLVTYNWDGPDCHVEFYEQDLNGYSFQAVGGNTGPSSNNNGGEVARSIRYPSEVTRYIRLTLP